MNTPRYIIVHHTGGTNANPLADSSNASFGGVNAQHKAQFNFISSLGYYIGYHYFIDKLGAVTQGRADTDEGAHTIGHNQDSIAICLAGNFDATLPTQAQKDALAGILARLGAKYGIPSDRIVPHRTFAAKTCYGRNLPDNWARTLITTPMKTIQITVVGRKGPLTEGAVEAEVEKYSRGRLTVDLKFIDIPRPTSNSQDLANELRAKHCPDDRFVIVLTQPEPEIYKTFGSNDGTGQIAVCGSDAKTISFEISHMLARWYNVNRTAWGLPYIQNEDVLTAPEDMRYRKYEVVMPYIELILGPAPSTGTSPVNEMMQLARDTKGGEPERVYALVEAQKVKLWIPSPETLKAGEGVLWGGFQTVVDKDLSAYKEGVVQVAIEQK